MGKAEIKLDYEAIGRVLTGTLRPVVTRAAANVAARAKGLVDKDVPVRVRPYTTDRAASAVVIAHPSGVALQAKAGVLTRAAAAEGLEVTSE